MQIQQRSYREVIRRARGRVRSWLRGGICDYRPEAGRDADSVVIGESEELILPLCRDLERGTLAPRYQAAERPDVTRSPTPRFDLLRVGAYTSLGVQFSRGCPFNCEFCDIIEVFGRRPRTKSPDQLIGEIEAIHATGYRGPLFIVDDNFIETRRA